MCCLQILFISSVNKQRMRCKTACPYSGIFKSKFSSLGRLFGIRLLVDTAIRYRIQYHALLNMYRVRNEGSGEVYNFSTLSAALDLMSAVRDFPVLEKAGLAPEKQYLLAVKVSIDREALPLPLRPIAYLDPQWYLSSDWTLWPLKK